MAIRKMTPAEYGVNGDGFNGEVHAEAKPHGRPKPEAPVPESGRGVSSTVPNAGPGGNRYTTEGGRSRWENQEHPMGGNPMVGGSPHAARYGHDR